jgi:hypothetical protein
MPYWNADTKQSYVVVGKDWVSTFEPLYTKRVLNKNNQFDPISDLRNLDNLTLKNERFPYL